MDTVVQRYKVFDVEGGPGRPRKRRSGGAQSKESPGSLRRRERGERGRRIGEGERGSRSPNKNRQQKRRRKRVVDARGGKGKAVVTDVHRGKRAQGTKRKHGTRPEARNLTN